MSGFAIAHAYDSPAFAPVPSITTFVAYHRPTSWGPLLEIDGKHYAIPPAVIEHFRNVGNIRKLATQPRIDVMTELFSDRDRYTRKILREVTASRNEPCIVFLDPDIGLEPTKPRLEHVLESELAQVWEAMRDGDVLVFYQH